MRLRDPGALETAVAAIGRRRAACGDDHEMLPGDPWGVLGYVLSHRDVPGRVLAEDAGDALIIVAALKAQIKDRERSAIRLARGQHRTWDQIAGYLGLGSPQAAQQHWQRLTGETPSRRHQQALHGAAQDEAGWLERFAGKITATAAELAAVSVPSAAVRDAQEDLLEALGEDPVAVSEVAHHLMLAANALIATDTLRYLGRGLRANALWLAAGWERVRDGEPA